MSQRNLQRRVVRQLGRVGATAAVLLTLADAVRGDTRADVVIHDVQVIDVRHGRVLPGRDVVVRGTRITSITPAGTAPVDAKVTIQGRGKFALPGMIDMAVTLQDFSRSGAAALLVDGVTGVRDLGTPPALIAAWRRELARGTRYSPRVIRACAGSPDAPAAPVESGCGPLAAGGSMALARLLDARVQERDRAPGVTRLGLHDALERLVRAGTSTSAALRAVTIEAAQALGAPDLGNMAPGMAADIVITTASPLADIRNLRTIDAVVFRGEALTRAHLNLLRAGAAASGAPRLPAR